MSRRTPEEQAPPRPQTPCEVEDGCPTLFRARPECLTPEQIGSVLPSRRPALVSPGCLSPPDALAFGGLCKSRTIHEHTANRMDPRSVRPRFPSSSLPWQRRPFRGLTGRLPSVQGVGRSVSPRPTPTGTCPVGLPRRRAGRALPSLSRDPADSENRSGRARMPFTSEPASRRTSCTRCASGSAFAAPEKGSLGAFLREEEHVSRARSTFNSIENTVFRSQFVHSLLPTCGWIASVVTPVSVALVREAKNPSARDTHSYGMRRRRPPRGSARGFPVR